MQNCAEFGKGFDFCKEEIEKYIERNKEVVEEKTTEFHSEPREILDVEDFLKWLKEQ